MYRPWRTIRGRLLLSANLAFGILLAVLLAVNARREYANAVAHQSESLDDEATAILEAVRHLSFAHGVREVQEYVDALSRGMQGCHGADQYIVVDLGGQLLIPSDISDSVARRLTQIMAVAQDQIADQITVHGRAFSMGSRSTPTLAVHIFEESTEIRRAIRRDAVQQLLTLAGLGAIAVAVMNIVLLKRIANPLKQLSATVRRIADGEYGLSAGRFSGDELQELASAVTTMSAALDEDRRRRTDLMQRAHAVQQHLLPLDVEIPGLEIATLFLPAEDVAGDYYDFIQLPDRTWIICLADVMGHGVPAAMGATIVKALVMTAVEQHAKPAEILTFINRHFTEALPTGFFASMFVGHWRPAEALLEYSSAGHVPGLLLTDPGETSLVSSTGFLVGVDPDAAWETRGLRIACREQLLLFTDGVTEALSPSHELFGRERLIRSRDLSRCRPAGDTIDAIRAALEDHHQGMLWSDDCTLLVLNGRCNGSACRCSSLDSRLDRYEPFRAPAGTKLV